MASRTSSAVANLLALYSVQIVNILVPLVTFPFLVRTLGVSQFGVITYVFSWMQIGIAIVGLGYNYTATLEASVLRNEPEKLSDLLLTVSLLKIAMGLLFGLGIVLLAMFDPILRDHMVLVVVSLVLVAGEALFPAWYLLGLERMRWIAFASIAGRVLGAVLLFAIVRSAEDINLAAFCQAIPTMLAALIVWIWIIRKDHFRLSSVELNSLNKRFVESARAFGTSLPGHIYARGQFIVLGQYVSAEDLGTYAIAQRITGIFSTLTAPLADTIFPRIGALLGDGDTSAVFRLQRTTILVSMGGGIAITIALILGAPLLVELITGLPDHPAAGTLIAMAPIVGVIGVSVLQRPFIMADKKYRLMFRVSLAGAGIFLLIATPLTFAFGITGMVYAMLAVETATMCMVLLFTRRKST